MSKPQSVQPDLSRRKFINRTLRITGGLCLASIGGWGLVNTAGRRTVWQIDPHICTQCGNCVAFSRQMQCPCRLVLRISYVLQVQ